MNPLASQQDIITEIGNQMQAHHHKKVKMPFVTLSFAQSLDGVISKSRSQATKISDWEADILTHRLRAIHHGILIGVNTLAVDDPQLNVRHVKGPSPVPIIIDPGLQSPMTSKIFQQATNKRPIVIVDHNHSQLVTSSFADKTNAGVYRIDFGSQDPILEILQTLKSIGLNSVMVEGGGKTIYHFVQGGWVNYFVMTLSPIFLGSKDSVRYSDFELHLDGMIAQPKYSQLGRDMIVYGNLSRQHFCHAEAL